MLEADKYRQGRVHSLYYWCFVVWCINGVDGIPKTQIYHKSMWLAELRPWWTDRYQDLTGDDLDGHASICIKKVRRFGA
jgi:hypothetical protein